MYDESVRQQALALLESGMSPREASETMGGHPGHAIIRRWAQGHVPVGKRRPSVAYSLREKLDALARLENGEDYQVIAQEVGCAPSTLLTWRRLYLEGGEDALRTRVDRLLEGRDVVAAHAVDSSQGGA